MLNTVAAINHEPIDGQSEGIFACMYVCMYVCIHVCMYLCMYICIYVCVCVSVRVLNTVAAINDEAIDGQSERMCMYSMCLYVCMHVRVCMQA